MTVKFVASANLPTEWGQLQIQGLEEEDDVNEQGALGLGKSEQGEALLGRMHSECLTDDELFSLRCDCGPQLQSAMESVAKEGRGLILYLRQEGRGIGLLNKIKAYALQDSGADTVEANVQLGFEPDSREYQICKPILDYFRVKRVRLMTNNPHKVDALNDMGIEVTEIVPIHTGANPHNESYLSVKVNKLGHIK